MNSNVNRIHWILHPLHCTRKICIFHSIQWQFDFTVIQLDWIYLKIHLNRRILLALKLHFFRHTIENQRKKKNNRVTAIESYKTHIMAYTLFNCFHSLQQLTSIMYLLALTHSLSLTHSLGIISFSPNLDLINTRLLSRSMYSAITWAAR